jgi:hypothetical protein
MKGETERVPSPYGTDMKMGRVTYTSYGRTSIYRNVSRLETRKGKTSKLQRKSEVKRKKEIDFFEIGK